MGFATNCDRDISADRVTILVFIYGNLLYCALEFSGTTQDRDQFRIVFLFIGSLIIFILQSPDRTLSNRKLEVHLSVQSFCLLRRSQMQTADCIFSQTLPGRSEEKIPTEGVL